MAQPPASFAARLKQLRIKSGESLQTASDAVGISKPHFWELEKGSSKNPSADLLQRLAKHYKVTVAYLVGEETEDAGELGALFRDVRGLDKGELANLRALVDSMKKQKQ